MKGLHMVTFTLLIIGGLNWLLVGAFGGFDLVAWLLGPMSTWSIIVYILVGVSALVELFTHKANCKNCSTPSV